MLTVTETMRELNLTGPEVIYRLLRSGALKGQRVGRVWEIDPESVAQRKRAISVKRSSRLNAAAERERKKSEHAARYAE
jgi:hypothetical protein